MISHYKINKRSVEEILKLGGDFYKNILEGQGGLEQGLENAYVGFENTPENPEEKLPNITSLWNLPTRKGFIYGSTLGHTHPRRNFSTQEIYEFEGYGGLLICNVSGKKLFVCKPGDKVPVPPNCLMTIFNFSQTSLTTFDMANPKQNKSSKEVLEKKHGPMIAFYNQGDNVGVRINNQYNVYDYWFGGAPYPLGFFTDPNMIYDESDFGITCTSIPSPTPLKPDTIFEIESGNLVDKLIENKNKFKEHDIEIVRASPVIRGVGMEGKKYCLDKPLLELVIAEDKPIHKLLGMI